MNQPPETRPVRKFWLLIGIAIGTMLVPVASGIPPELVWTRVRRRTITGAEWGWKRVSPHVDRVAERIRSGLETIKGEVLPEKQTEPGQERSDREDDRQLTKNVGKPAIHGPFGDLEGRAGACRGPGLTA
jgi:hypothetical protein